MKLSPSFHRGILYGSVGAALGAAAWTIIGLFQVEMSEIPILSFIGFFFWGIVGFIVGLFGPTRQSGLKELPRLANGKPKRTILGTIGRFIYRTVVGGLAGFLVAALLELAMIALAMVTHGGIEPALKATYNSPIGMFILCYFNGAIFGAQVCGIFFAPIWAVDEIDTLIWGSVCGALIGSVGGIIPLLFTRGVALIWAATLGGILGGAVAAVLAGFLILRRQEVKWVPPPSIKPDDLSPSGRQN